MPLLPSTPDAASLTGPQQESLLHLARIAIASHWQETAQVELAELSSRLQPIDAPTACFVTLHDAQGELRGCIGTLQAEQPLLSALTLYARAAAFHDPRFLPLAFDELPQLTLSITLLGPLIPLPASGRQELANRLIPDSDGLVLRQGHRSATFLPSVWRQLPTQDQFISALLRKGGWSSDEWPEGIQAWRYTGTEFSEAPH